MNPLSFAQTLFKKRMSSKVLLLSAVSAAILVAVFAPETFATEVALNAQLNKVTGVASGGIAKTGLIVGTICSAVMGLFKNSWVIFLSSIGIGVGLSYYLDFLKVWTGVTP